MKNGLHVIDGDGHMQEPLDIWEKYCEAGFAEHAQVIGAVGRTIFKYAPCSIFPNGRPNPRPEVLFEKGPARYGEAYESWWSLPSRLKHMDQEGIDIMVGFPTNGAQVTNGNIKDAEVQAALCRAYNNWATDYCSDARGRVKFVAMVTALDVQETIAEVVRIKDRPEVAAVMLPDPGKGRLWSGAEFEPLWGTLQDAQLAPCFHGGNAQFRWFGDWMASGDGAMAAVSHAMAFPSDAMMSMGTIIFGGVLERYPNLKVGFYESNAGWVPWWLARLDDHAVGRQAPFNYGFKLPLKPSEYFKRQCFVAADVDEGTLPDLVRVTGGDNILFNTDYPHPDALFPGAVDTFLNQDIPVEAARKILWDNPVALYGKRVSGVPAAA